MLIYLLFFATLFLAYVNGANDNFKGVATLYGSGTCSYKTAITIATIATFAGSISAIFLAQGLISSFSGKGLVPQNVAGATDFLMAVSFGAACTVLLATRLGFPISTTHSLVGGLFGAGLMAVGWDVNFNQLGTVFFIPLLVSPFIAFALGATAYWIIGNRKDNKLLDIAHTTSGAAVSFARGLNDTPKIAGLLVAAQALDIRFAMVAIALGMAIGGLLNARRVAETISHKITEINHSQGFSANLVTSFLVIIASKFGIPVSTTHVSVGSIFGIGMISGNANAKVISSIILSWLITLPVAIFFSALMYYLVS
ncbi:inorganic phosphate transporter [Candidatus Marithrix sp. Canyon 246]|uniref:inorganic phosphate transporter n=2 Tax=Candidatus Marithrix sp. Canyon 246 TaxID=1827136 RepID=UPI00084A0A79|nr:inorganic phosphate transporter [Candidatus Marithrix sp. Canyon 246]